MFQMYFYLKMFYDSCVQVICKYTIILKYFEECFCLKMFYDSYVQVSCKYYVILKCFEECFYLKMLYGSCVQVSCKYLIILKCFEECSHSCGYKLNAHLAKIFKLAFNVVMNTFVGVMMLQEWG